MTPRSVALLGPDVVLLAMESLGGGSKGASGNASLALALAGAVEARRVSAALVRMLAICPWLGAQLVRPWPWGKLEWRVPPDFTEKEVDVILTIADATGQEIFQTFKLAVRDRKPDEK